MGRDASSTRSPVSRYIEGLKWTGIVAFGGLAITIVIGMHAGHPDVAGAWVESAVYPYLVALQAIPVLAIVPLIYSVFGGGLAPRFFVCIMIAFFPIVTNTLFGLISADPGQHDLFTLAQRVAMDPARQAATAVGAADHLHRLPHLRRPVGDRRRRRRAVLPQRRASRASASSWTSYRVKGIYAPLYGGVILACLLGIVTFLLFGWLGKLVVGTGTRPASARRDTIRPIDGCAHQPEQREHQHKGREPA